MENICPETIVRTYQIADWCGNVQTCTQTIRINDSIPPEFVGIPENETVQCDAVPDPPQIGLEIQIIENCGDPEIVFFEEIIPGVCENTYDIIRTWTATDGCANTVIATQEITVVDCHPDVSIQINPNPACLGHDVTLIGTVSNFYSNPGISLASIQKRFLGGCAWRQWIDPHYSKCTTLRCSTIPVSRLRIKYPI